MIFCQMFKKSPLCLGFFLRNMHFQELIDKVTKTPDEEELLAVREKNRELEQKVSAAEEKFKEMERKNEDVIKINQVCMMIFCQMFKKSPYNVRDSFYIIICTFRNLSTK